MPLNILRWSTQGQLDKEQYNVRYDFLKRTNKFWKCPEPYIKSNVPNFVVPYPNKGFYQGRLNLINHSISGTGWRWLDELFRFICSLVPDFFALWLEEDLPSY